MVLGCCCSTSSTSGHEPYAIVPCARLASGRLRSSTVRATLRFMLACCPSYLSIEARRTVTTEVYAPIGEGTRGGLLVFSG